MVLACVRIIYLGLDVRLRVIQGHLLSPLIMEEAAECVAFTRRGEETCVVFWERVLSWGVACGAYSEAK